MPATQAGKMFSATHDSHFGKPGEKFLCETDYLLGRVPCRAATQHVLVFRACQIKHGRKVNVQREGRQFPSHRFAQAGCETGLGNVSNRRQWSQCRSQAVHLAAFRIDSQKRWCLNMLTDLPCQAVKLWSGLDIARKKDHPAGLDAEQQIFQIAVPAVSFETYNEELP